ncbi:MAG: DUF6580 family putative transport protein [Planctomycetaceae bacterium]
MIQPRPLVVGGMILLATGIRLLPYVLDAVGLGDVRDVAGMPWNFSPMSAICLFGGACLADRRWAYAVPLASLVLSDLGIGLLMGDLKFGMHPMIPVVYGATLLVVWLGTWLKRPLNGASSTLQRVAAIGGTALLGEAAFFLITNFANWAMQSQLPFSEPQRYPYTLSGLAMCYVAAIPFLKNALLGTAMYATALFGGYALVQHHTKASAAAPVLAEVHS